MFLSKDHSISDWKMIKFLLIFGLFEKAFAANILFLNQVASPSHHIFNYALAEGLALKGHNVTYFSPDVPKTSPESLTAINFPEAYDIYHGDGEDTLDLIELSKESSLKGLEVFYTFSLQMCIAQEKAEGVKLLLNYPDDFKFDLVIYDLTVGPCLLGMIHKFKYPPVIGVTAFNIPPYIVDIMGGSKLGLLAPPYYTLLYDNNMNFFQRIHNGLMHFIDSVYRKYKFLPDSEAIMKKVYGQKLPAIQEIECYIQVALVNSNPAIDIAESLPPNIIEVGGLQIKEAKPLPAEMKEFIERGKKGTVLMSLGSNIRSDALPKDTQISIIEAFKQLPDYNFIWKFESDDLPAQLPKNVMVQKWLPQNDVLAHPKIVAFISHGGLLSLHETMWWGKPVVAIPFFSDQHGNSHKAVNNGIAKKVNFQKIETKSFKATVLEVLENPKYKNNVQSRSKKFRDQKETPLERAIWWCEYLIRNKNANHLRTDYVALGILGPLLLDIQIILIFMIVSFITVMYYLYKFIMSSSNSVSEDKKKV